MPMLWWPPSATTWPSAASRRSRRIPRPAPGPIRRALRRRGSGSNAGSRWRSTTSGFPSSAGSSIEPDSARVGRHARRRLARRGPARRRLQHIQRPLAGFLGRAGFVGPAGNGRRAIDSRAAQRGGAVCIPRCRGGFVASGLRQRRSCDPDRPALAGDPAGHGRRTDRSARFRDIEANLMTDPDLQTNAASLAVALGINSGTGDFAYVAVIQLKPFVFSNAWFTSWRQSYDQGACSQSSGLKSTSSTTIAGRQVFVGHVQRWGADLPRPPDRARSGRLDHLGRHGRLRGDGHQRAQAVGGTATPRGSSVAAASGPGR